MNEPSSALRAAAIERAARAIQADKLQVIDRDWQSGEHPLDLAATPGAGIFAAVEVRVAAARERAALRLAGTPWRVNTEIPRNELLRRFMPGGGWEPIERATSLGMVSDFAAADALRVAWTLADLNGRERPTRGDWAAALGLRMEEMR
jgi:magnesium chelatase family protein